MFVVLTRGRTGSTPLVEDLDQHPEVICHQELFRTSSIVMPNDRVPAYETGAAVSAADYLRLVAEKSCAPVVGFKLLLNQLDEHAAIDLKGHIWRSGMPVIHLTRQPERLALSAAIARARSAYNLHRLNDDAAYRQRLAQKVRLDPQFVSDEARYAAYWTNTYRAELRDAGLPHVEVTYEDYVADRLATVNAIFRFLGVAELSGLDDNPYSKVTSADVWDDVINRDEVSAALNGGP